MFHKLICLQSYLYSFCCSSENLETRKQYNSKRHVFGSIQAKKKQNCNALCSWALTTRQNPKCLGKALQQNQGARCCPVPWPHVHQLQKNSKSNEHQSKIRVAEELRLPFWPSSSSLPPVIAFPSTSPLFGLFANPLPEGLPVSTLCGSVLLLLLGLLDSPSSSLQKCSAAHQHPAQKHAGHTHHRLKGSGPGYFKLESLIALKKVL